MIWPVVRDLSSRTGVGSGVREGKDVNVGAGYDAGAVVGVAGGRVAIASDMTCPVVVSDEFSLLQAVKDNTSMIDSRKRKAAFLDI